MQKGQQVKLHGKVETISGVVSDSSGKIYAVWLENRADVVKGAEFKKVTVIK